MRAAAEPYSLQHAQHCCHLKPAMTATCALTVDSQAWVLLLQVLVMETKAARTANKAILQQHQIPYDRSVDLREASGTVVEANGTSS